MTNITDNKPSHISESAAKYWHGSLTAQQVNDAIDAMWDVWKRNPYPRNLRGWHSAVQSDPRWPSLTYWDAIDKFTARVLDHIASSSNAIENGDNQYIVLAPKDSKIVFVPRKDFDDKKTKENDPETFVNLYRSIPHLPDVELQKRLIKELRRLRDDIHKRSHEAVLRSLFKGSIRVSSLTEAIRSLELACKNGLSFSVGDRVCFVVQNLSTGFSEEEFSHNIFMTVEKIYKENGQVRIVARHHKGYAVVTDMERNIISKLKE